MFSTYDQWKLASPDDRRSWEPEPGPFFCDACQDVGWMLDQDDRVVPCCECSAPVTIEDFCNIS